MKRTLCVALFTKSVIKLRIDFLLTKKTINFYFQSLLCSLCFKTFISSKHDSYCQQQSWEVLFVYYLSFLSLCFICWLLCSHCLFLYILLSSWKCQRQIRLTLFLCILHFFVNPPGFACALASLFPFKLFWITFHLLFRISFQDSLILCILILFLTLWSEDGFLMALSWSQFSDVSLPLFICPICSLPFLVMKLICFFYWRWWIWINWDILPKN